MELKDRSLKFPQSTSCNLQLLAIGCCQSRLRDAQKVSRAERTKSETEMLQQNWPAMPAINAWGLSLSATVLSTQKSSAWKNGTFCCQVLLLDALRRAVKREQL